MNIFVTSPNPYLSAVYLDDKRVVKMTLESAQIICTTLHLKGLSAPYKPTHIRHPVVLWAAVSPDNLSWLIRHHTALAQVYESIYKREHLSFCKVGRIYQNLINSENSKTDFVNCTRRSELNIDFTEEPDVHVAYRRYLNKRWKLDHVAPTWKGREKPIWIDN